MEYIVDNYKYHFSYNELKEKHYQICSMSNEAFLENIPAALHLACFIGYLKEFNHEIALSDRSIIHQLVHLLHIDEIPDDELKELRQLYKEVLYLS